MKPRTIAQLKKESYRGMDKSLATSLLEYNLIWKTEGDDFKFIYKHPSISDRFDWGNVHQNTDPRKEWDWVNFAQVAETNGLTEEQLFSLPLPEMVYSLINYYGVENIMGTSYTEGFEVHEC